MMIRMNRRRVLQLSACALAATGSARAADGARVVERIEIGDVPVLVSRPAVPRTDARLILLYHGFGRPGSPDELAAALPLDGSDFVAAYVNLPLFARRLPEGGVAALQRLQQHDFVNGLFFRCIEGAVSEMPGVVDHLAALHRLDVSRGVDLFGFSAGGSAVLLALIESPLPVAAAVVVNAPLSVRQNVASWEHALHREFAWDASSLRAAQRFDLVPHADAIARRRPSLSLLMMQSEADEHLSVQPMLDARTALQRAYGLVGRGGDVSARTLPGQTHDFATSPHTVASRTLAWFEAHRA